MNEHDFAALNAHLDEVRPIFDRFCTQHGFTWVDKRSLGRYPRVRIEREGEVAIWFELTMALDEHGQRIDRFTPDALYELGAGGSITVQDGSRFGTRFQKTFWCFSDVPFHKVPAILMAEMEKNLPQLEQWDAEHLKAQGQRIRLGGG